MHTHTLCVCVYDNVCKSLSSFAVLKCGLQQSCTNKQNEQHEEEDCLNTNCYEPEHLVVDEYWNTQQLDMCIQKSREGQIKFTFKGYSAF